MADNVNQLIALFGKSIRDIPMHHVKLNPKFEEFSYRVGGADADFIFVNTLIDIKATAKLGYKTEDMAQVIGYAAMSRAIGRPVDRVGIYFARFGLFAALSLADSGLDETFLEEYLGALMEAGDRAKPRTRV